MNCKKCHAGLSRLRLISAAPERNGKRRAQFQCLDCGTGFTLLDGGIDFNAAIMTASTNTRKPYAKRHLMQCPLLLWVNSPKRRMA